MIPLDSATAIFPRMPTGMTIAGEFPLTIIKPPVVDVKCRASPSAISSPIYRLLRSRNQRRNSSATSSGTCCSAKTENKQFLPERVDVFELKDATRQSMQVESGLRGHGRSTSTLPDNMHKCYEKSGPARRNSLVSSAKESLVCLHDETSDATEIPVCDNAKELQTQRVLLVEIKQNENLIEVESKQNDNCSVTEGEENDEVSLVQTQEDDDTTVMTETNLNEYCPTIKTKLDQDFSGIKQNENSPKAQADKRNTKKLCTAKKSTKKRRNSVKKSPGMTGIFSRLAGTHGCKKHQVTGQLPNSKQAEPKACSQQSKDNSSKYLNIQKLHATYAPKKTDNKSNTVILLPRVSNTSLTTDKNSGHVHSTPSSPRKHQHELESNVSPQSSLSQKLLNSDDDKVKKIYLSDAHSGMITGVPCAPPCTPTVDELKKVEYIPSLTDVKSQRAVKARLVTLGNKIRADEQKKKEKAAKEEQKKAYGAILQLKQRQRAEIYALNKVMTDLENENFRKFMEEHSAETLPV